jgi:hypothetical protein
VSVRVSFTGGGCTSLSSSCRRESRCCHSVRVDDSEDGKFLQLNVIFVVAVVMICVGRQVARRGADLLAPSVLCELWTWMSVESGMKGKEENAHLLTGRTSCCRSRFFVLISSLFL